jgi:arylsulfatase A-like enzyme
MKDILALIAAALVVSAVEITGYLAYQRTLGLDSVLVCAQILLALAVLGCFVGAGIALFRLVVVRIQQTTTLWPWLLTGTLHIGLVVLWTTLVRGMDYRNLHLEALVMALGSLAAAGFCVFLLFELGRWPKRVMGWFGALLVIPGLLGLWLWFRDDVDNIGLQFLDSLMTLLVSGMFLSWVFWNPGFSRSFESWSKVPFKWIPVALVGIAVPVLAVPWASQQHARSVESGAPLAGVLFHSLAWATDFDGDGASQFLGQGDCAPWDSSVFPGAFDIPDDGIDQDCDGADAGGVDLLVLPQPVWYPTEAMGEEPFNVLLISVDAMRRDHMSVYGYHRPTTPNLDLIAQQATVFRHSFAHSSRTLYSLTAFLYGVPVSLIDWDRPDTRNIRLPGDLKGLPTLARRHGVATRALLDCFRIFKLDFGLDRDFDQYDTSSVCVSSYQPVQKKAPERTSALLHHLSELEQEERPFFAWVHYLEPHAPYTRPSNARDFGDEPMDKYDSLIHHIDGEIAIIWDYLHVTGLIENTVIIVTADHGDEFLEHGQKHHGKTLYNETIGVPLIVYVPGVPGQVNDTPVSHLDVVPTVLNLLGIPHESWPRLYGRNLLHSIVDGVSSADQFTFAIHANQRTFSTLDITYIQPPYAIIKKGKGNLYELYDIEKDYLQQNDLYSPGDPVSTLYRSRIDALSQFLGQEQRNLSQ